MPEHRDPGVYRLQARLWRAKADAVSSDAERDVCLAIADGYIRLAQLIEERASVDTGAGDGRHEVGHDTGSDLPHYVSAYLVCTSLGYNW